MKETIEHKCTISWGMLMGDDIGSYINKLIEDKKLEVSLALEKCGFDVIDQHFIPNCEWGTLITWAELIENPNNVWVQKGEREVKFGNFYKKD